MSEDLGNHRGVFDGGDDLQGAAATRGKLPAILEERRIAYRGHHRTRRGGPIPSMCINREADSLAPEGLTALRANREERVGRKPLVGVPPHD